MKENQSRKRQQEAGTARERRRAEEQRLLTLFALTQRARGPGPGASTRDARRCRGCGRPLLRRPAADTTETGFPRELQSGRATNENTPIQPDRLYTTEEAAPILGLARDTVYRIPRAQLPRVRVGPKGGGTRILGADLLEYMQRRSK